MPDAVDKFDVGISIDPAIDPELADGFALELRDAGLRAEVEVRESSVYAGIEWLVPTAIAVFFAEKYIGTLLQEAAKDHYPKVKAALLRLIKVTTGPEREVRVRFLASSPAKLRAADPVVLSLCARLRSGSVTFIFEHSIDADSATAAVHELFELLIEHELKYPNDRLTRTPAALPGSHAAPIVMRFNSAAGQWECWILNGERDEKST
jgi:hypothetical protein